MPQHQLLSASEIGARIRYAREKSGRSQQDIAQQLGISQNSVQKIENGKVGRSRYVTKLWELVGLDAAELNPALKPEPPRPVIGYAQSPLVLKRMTSTEREADLIRRAYEQGYELGRSTERLTKADEIELAIVEPGNGGEFEIGMKFIRPDGTSVPFAVSLAVARSTSGLLLQVLDQIEAMTRQTNRYE
jgi:Predicted transcription factor, homolog of eukaryotic MBF1